MARINLLPWREERREQRKKQFFAMLGIAALAAAALFWVVKMQIDGTIDYQQSRNQRLETEIRQLDAQIAEIEQLERTREQLLRRKQVIDDLQASRSQMVHLFDEVVRTIPEGVRLSSIRQQGQVLTMDGVAQSNARVSAYLRNLDASEWLAAPELDVVRSRDEDEAAEFRYEFSLRARLTNPNAPEEDDTLEGEDWQA